LQQNCIAWQFKFEQKCQKHESEITHLIADFNTQINILSQENQMLRGDLARIEEFQAREDEARKKIHLTD
jgi:cupin superfamily acireductone dioxygenase involved in methionine salvage